MYCINCQKITRNNGGTPDTRKCDACGFIDFIPAKTNWKIRLKKLLSDDEHQCSCAGCQMMLASFIETTLSDFAERQMIEVKKYLRGKNISNNGCRVCEKTDKIIKSL